MKKVIGSGHHFHPLQSLRAAKWCLSSPHFFDADWYRDSYPDMAQSRQGAWSHFVRFGSRENRMVAAWEVDQWFDESLARSLAQQYESLCPKLSSLEKQHVSCSLARSCAARGEWVMTKRLIELTGLLDNDQPTSVWRLCYGRQASLLLADARRHLGASQESVRKLLEANKSSDSQLSLANLATSPEEWSHALSALFEPHGLAGLKVDQLSFDRLSSHSKHSIQGPLISVLVPAYNAQATLEQAIKSLLSQTYRSLEIIIVDDGSTDRTSEVMRHLKAFDERVKLLHVECSRGAYYARNLAMEQATGHYITVHDADDWSHPEKIEQQFLMLRSHTEFKACLSSWARLSNDLKFGGWGNPSNWVNWIHRNSSSLMVRRSVFEVLGYWDEVRCNGDTEYIDRILHSWGQHSIGTVLPDTPLAFGRSHPASMTHQSETSILTALKGLRRDYQQAYRSWHRQADSSRDLYLSRSPSKRPFEVSQAMLL